MENEILKLKERIEIALEVGESHYCEFKSAHEVVLDEKGKMVLPRSIKPRNLKEIGEDIAKTLVAFANADGGILLVGVEDDSKVTGLPYSEDKLDAIIKSPNTYVMQETPLPLKRSVIVEFKPGIKVAFFSVEKGSRFVHVTSQGKCFQRRDDKSLPASPDAIKFERDEETSRTYDRQFIDLANVTDLDLDLVSMVARQVSKSMTPEKFLQYLELAEFDGVMRLKLRRAALLLFAKNVGKWHPRCQVRILKVKGNEEGSGADFNVTEVAELSSNLFTLYEQSWEALRPHLTETRFSKDAIFKTQIIYPEDACREALINAITHRDYSVEGRGIEIRIFDDRLEILSPGKILSSISVIELEKLEGVHETRNTYIARVLREYGYIRELGEGIRRIFKLMQESELVAPQITSPNKSFIVTLFHRQIYSKEQKIWLDLFGHLSLTRDERTVVSIGVAGRLLSRKEITDAVGITDTTVFTNLVNELQKKRILVSTIPQTKKTGEAKSKGVDLKDLPRFKVVTPEEGRMAHELQLKSKNLPKVIPVWMKPRN